MSKKSKIWGLFNIFDFVVFSVLIVSVVGVILIKTGKISNTPEIVKTKQEVEFDVILRSEKYSGEEELFKPGESSFITIRNVPYTRLEIVAASKTHWKTAIADPKNPKKAIAVEDPSAPYTYNFLVTLKDHALMTEDGAVIGGNKVKIGLPVQLEGFKYKFSGVVSDIRLKKPANI